MYKTVLLWLLIAAGAGMLLQVALINTNTELYDWLDAFMEERKVLWSMPQPKGTREVNVSPDVCQGVSLDKLDEVMAKHPFFMTTNVVSKEMGLPADTRTWRITRSLGLLDNQTLSIYLGPGGYCQARYRHHK